MKSGIRIVMVATSHPGNIGAAARAMKNMCLSELVLVQPKDFPSDAAFARASGADDLLRAAVVTGSLAEAVADCRTVIGASARLRSVRWPQLAPREAAALAVAESRSAPVALVFGRESAGLSNQELDLCTHLVQIPTNPAYSSLNVAMAVQVISYEVMLASQAAERRPDEAATVHAVRLGGQLAAAVALPLAGIASFALVVAACGGRISFAGAASVALAAMAAAALVPTPGGVGGVEAVVGLGLVLLGVPLASAAAAVVVWRVLTLWLPLAVGVVPFRRAAAASLGRAVLA